MSNYTWIPPAHVTSIVEMQRDSHRRGFDWCQTGELMRRRPCDFTVTRLSSPVAGRATAWPASLPFSSRLWLKGWERRGSIVAFSVRWYTSITLQFRRVNLFPSGKLLNFCKISNMFLHSNWSLHLFFGSVFGVFCCCWFFFCLNNATSVSFIRSLPVSLKVYWRSLQEKIETPATKNKANVLVSIFLTVPQLVEWVVQWLKSRRFESWLQLSACWSVLGQDTKP